MYTPIVQVRTEFQRSKIFIKNWVIHKSSMQVLVAKDGVEPSTTLFKESALPAELLSICMP